MLFRSCAVPVGNLWGKNFAGFFSTPRVWGFTHVCAHFFGVVFRFLRSYSLFATDLCLLTTKTVFYSIYFNINKEEKYAIYSIG